MTSQPPGNGHLNGLSPASTAALAADNQLRAHDACRTFPTSSTLQASPIRCPSTSCAEVLSGELGVSSTLGPQGLLTTHEWGPREPETEAGVTKCLDTRDPFSDLIEESSSHTHLLKLQTKEKKGAADGEEASSETPASLGSATALAAGEMRLSQPSCVSKDSSFCADFAALNALKKQQQQERRDSSTDDSVSPLEYAATRSSSSLLPEGVSAVGEGKLVHLDGPSRCSPLEFYDIAAACQQTTELAASALAPHGAMQPPPALAATAAPETAAGISSSALGAGGSPSGGSHVAEAAAAAGAAEPPETEAAAATVPEAAAADVVDGDSSMGCMQWPFESGVRPWDDLGQDTREIAEGASGTQLEDLPKKRIWVFHRVKLAILIPKPYATLCEAC